jgi:hypothetical protein
MIVVQLNRGKTRRRQRNVCIEANGSDIDVFSLILSLNLNVELLVLMAA